MFLAVLAGATGILLTLAAFISIFVTFESFVQAAQERKLANESADVDQSKSAKHYAAAEKLSQTYGQRWCAAAHLVPLAMLAVITCGLAIAEEDEEEHISFVVCWILSCLLVLSHWFAAQERAPLKSGGGKRDPLSTFDSRYHDALAFRASEQEWT